MSSPLSYALRLLKHRLRSAWEIDQALARKGVEQEEREKVLQHLAEADLINDVRYADAWIHTRDLLAPRGDYVLQQELRKRGVDQEIIKAALRKRKEAAENDEEQQPDQEALARKVLAGKERAYAHLAPEVRKRRLMSLLMRRGFSYEVTRRILEA